MRHGHCRQQPRRYDAPKPGVSLLQPCLCGQVCHSFNKIGPWKDARNGSSLLCLGCLQPSPRTVTCRCDLDLRRTTMPDKVMSALSDPRPLARTMQIWMSWTRLLGLKAPRTTGIWSTFGLKFRSRAFVSRLPGRCPCRRYRRKQSSRSKHQGGCEHGTVGYAPLLHALLLWSHRHSHTCWAEFAGALYVESSNHIAHHLHAHPEPIFESHLGPKSQSPTNTLALYVIARATQQGLQTTGRAEPRVGNLSRRFSGSARQSPSAEKPRPELLFLYQTMQADTSDPACCIHDMASQNCGSSPNHEIFTLTAGHTIPDLTNWSQPRFPMKPTTSLHKPALPTVLRPAHYSSADGCNYC